MHDVRLLWRLRRFLDLLQKLLPLSVVSRDSVCTAFARGTVSKVPIDVSTFVFNVSLRVHELHGAAAAFDDAQGSVRLL